MQETDKAQQLKQAQFIFWLNLALTLFAFSAFVKSMGSNVSWKLACSGTGFVLFLGLTTILFVRMMRLRKASKN